MLLKLLELNCNACSFHSELLPFTYYTKSKKTYLIETSRKDRYGCHHFDVNLWLFRSFQWQSCKCLRYPVIFSSGIQNEASAGTFSNQPTQISSGNYEQPDHKTYKTFSSSLSKACCYMILRLKRCDAIGRYNRAFAMGVHILHLTSLGWKQNTEYWPRNTAQKNIQVEISRSKATDCLQD